MSTYHATPASGDDPYAVLGLREDANEAEIRAAYLRKVKEFPPERAPSEFERVRDAYEFLRDPKVRAWRMLRAADPSAPLLSVLGPAEDERRFVGPECWLAALKEKAF